MRNVDENKYRKRKGPKPWNAMYESKVDTRISSETNNGLNRLADRYDVSRSALVRKALEDFIRFNEGDNRRER